MTSTKPVDEIAPAPAPSGSADSNSTAAASLPDFEKLAVNAARFIEQSGRALAQMMKPAETAELGKSDMSDALMSAAFSVGRVAEHWMSDPTRVAEAQSALAIPFLQLWENTFRQLKGEDVPPLVPVGKDKRFAAPDWSKQPIYSFLRQAHAIASTWADRMVDEASNVDPLTRDRAKFYLRQVTMALSPANFLVTNPELMRQTLETSGENLVRGAEQLAEDIEAGGGRLRIRQTDTSQFELGVNVAVTPGKVVLRTDVMELIQYEPTTPDVLKRPLLIVPPWINKFYILDLNRDKSFVSWAVSQGVSVFLVSWVNPDERHRDKTFESYMREGIFAALEAIAQTSGEHQVNAVGYCIGGTLLATTLAYMARVNDDRIASATFLTAQTDFTAPGELRFFTDEEQVRSLELQMAERGYLEGSYMANAFNLMRPNDLLWTYVVDNYIKGKKPAAFDLLFWNSDSTRLPATNHAFYLRNFYLENKLAKGEMTFGGELLCLADIKIPVYFLATREDHIAPADSVYRGAKMFGGPVRFVLSGSGHIAGVVNPPSKAKYQYWTGQHPFGTFAEWIDQAVETPGSWWPDWSAWLEAQASERIGAWSVGRNLTILADAPGDYVRARS